MRSERNASLVKLSIWIGLSLLSIWPWAAPSEARETWSRVKTEILDLSRNIHKDTALTKDLVTRDEQSLKQELKSLKQSVAKLEAGLREKQEKLSELETQEQTLRHNLKQELDEVRGVQGTVLAGAREVQSLFRDAPLGPALNTDLEFLELLENQETMPGMNEIRSLVDVSFQVMEASEDIIRFKGSFLETDGQTARGDIVRIGGIEALYCTADACGFLRPGPDPGVLHQVPADLSWFLQRDIRAYLRGEEEQTPLDISNGAVFERLAGQKTWKEWIQDGGFLLWPIFGVGLLALALGLERLVFILRIRSNSERIMQTITSLIQKGRWQESLDFCRQNRNSPTSQVMASGLECIGQSKQILDNAMQEALLKLLPRLERFLPTLSVLAAIAPLLGLLGTVTGMITTFQTITIFGTGDPKHMAGGISEALITTQAGLMVAVPIMFLHHILDRRIEKILGDIEEKGARLSLLLLQHGTIEDRDAEQA